MAGHLMIERKYFTDIETPYLITSTHPSELGSNPKVRVMKINDI